MLFVLTMKWVVDKTLEVAKSFGEQVYLISVLTLRLDSF